MASSLSTFLRKRAQRDAKAPGKEAKKEATIKFYMYRVSRASADLNVTRRDLCARLSIAFSRRSVLDFAVNK